MFDETDDINTPTVTILDTLPASTETMDMPEPPKVKRGRKAGVSKAETPKGNGKAKDLPAFDETVYFLVSNEDDDVVITIESDGDIAAAKAILNNKVSLYRAVPIAPKDVFRGKK
jgi:hypothetical protein